MSDQPAPAWAKDVGHVVMSPMAHDTDGARGLDRVLIAERLYRYGWSYDERNRELLADCFTEDAVWEGNVMGGEIVGPHEGRDAVMEFLTGFWEIQDDQRRHIFTNVIVDDLTETTAVAHGYILLTASKDATMTPVTAGPYRLAMRKQADGWRIARLTGGFDAPF